VRPETGTDAVDAILYAAHRIRRAADAALREHGLSLPALKLLKALAARDRSMGEISQVLHVSPRTVTDMIDGLEGRGLVTRGPHASDRRVTLLARASTAADQAAATAVSALDQHEQRTLRHLLDRVCSPV